MRETRLSGSEGGGTSRFSLPLSKVPSARRFSKQRNLALSSFKAVAHARRLAGTQKP